MLHRYYYISLFVSFFDINRPLASQIFDENQILGFLYQGTEFQVLAAGLGKPQQLNEHWQSFRSQERTWSLYHFLLLFDARDDIEREKSQ